MQSFFFTLIFFVLFVKAQIKFNNPHVSVNIWMAFKNTNSRNYKSVEQEQKAYSTFGENVRLMKNHNAKHDKGEVTFRLGENKYADVPHEQFIKMMNGAKPKLPANRKLHKSYESVRASLPTSVDWRKQQFVTPVKDQGECGSCYAFSSTGSLEGLLAKKAKRKAVSLSDQNLMDCVYGDAGCDGGWMGDCFDYVIKNKGINKEKAYPYTNQPNDKCSFKNMKSSIGGKCLETIYIESGDERALQDAVANVGPISVAIDADPGSFQLYKSGVFYDAKCTNNSNHAVLLVGYGTEKGVDYWLVKNSWSTSWGDKGYVKMARNKGNHCGIASFGVYCRV